MDSGFIRSAATTMVLISIALTAIVCLHEETDENLFAVSAVITWLYLPRFDWFHQWTKCSNSLGELPDRLSVHGVSFTGMDWKAPHPMVQPVLDTMIWLRITHAKQSSNSWHPLCCRFSSLHQRVNHNKNVLGLVAPYAQVLWAYIKSYELHNVMTPTVVIFKHKHHRSE